MGKADRYGSWECLQYFRAGKLMALYCANRDGNSVDGKNIIIIESDKVPDNLTEYMMDDTLKIARFWPSGQGWSEAIAYVINELEYYTVKNSGGMGAFISLVVHKSSAVNSRGIFSMVIDTKHYCTFIPEAIVYMQPISDGEHDNAQCVAEKLYNDNLFRGDCITVSTTLSASDICIN